MDIIESFTRPTIYFKDSSIEKMNEVDFLVRLNFHLLMNCKYLLDSYCPIQILLLHWYYYQFCAGRSIRTCPTLRAAYAKDGNRLASRSTSPQRHFWFKNFRENQISKFQTLTTYGILSKNGGFRLSEDGKTAPSMNNSFDHANLPKIWFSRF